MEPMLRETATLRRAELSVLAAGEGDPVVLLHGIPTGAELWRPVIQRLVVAGHRGLAPDLPGYGMTRLPASGDHSLAGSAQLVAEWLEESGLAPAWVVGHDSGGAVGQILAVRHPGSVRRLTLTNSIADGSWPAPRARFAKAAAHLGLYRAAARLRMVPNPYMRWQIGRAFADPTCASAAAHVLWDSKFSEPEGRAAFERHLRSLSSRDTSIAAAGLRTLDVPCQLVWGMADPFQPWEAPGRRLAEQLRDPAITMLEGCGHFTPLECPERLVGAMLDWAATGSGPSRHL
jgi:pimeloyl-ACP methyl ester carboxylesterase